MSMDTWESFIRSFVVRDRQGRYLGLLQSAKGQSKLRESLDHFGDLDPSAQRQIPPNQQTPKDIEMLLMKLGARPICQRISSRSGFDNAEIPLSEALQEAIGYGFGTVLVCVPGKLAFFEGEGPKDRCLLVR